jgi:hypothetical protein
MNVKLNSIVLALAFASSLLDGVAAASQQQQLRGSPDNNSPQRNMAVAGVGSISCPPLAPTNGDSCVGVLSPGSTNGYCGWQRSSWDGDGTKTTTIDKCSCGQQSIWSCSKDIETNTSPPVPSPPPATVPTPSSDSTWCLLASGSTGDICTLPDGKSSGSCTNWSTTADRVTTKNVCTCTRSASPTFVCTQTISN